MHHGDGRPVLLSDVLDFAATPRVLVVGDFLLHMPECEREYRCVHVCGVIEEERRERESESVCQGVCEGLRARYPMYFLLAGVGSKRSQSRHKLRSSKSSRHVRVGPILMASIGRWRAPPPDPRWLGKRRG